MDNLQFVPTAEAKAEAMKYRVRHNKMNEDRDTKHRKQSEHIRIVNRMQTTNQRGNF